MIDRLVLGQGEGEVVGPRLQLELDEAVRRVRVDALPREIARDRASWLGGGGERGARSCEIVRGVACIQHVSR